ncbi:hypothetical protein TNCV_1814881 [Trichonephila clavipes]|nr:hypothetical protein TNCV_1814881 [Trichonephila clavipes]
METRPRDTWIIFSISYSLSFHSPFVVVVALGLWSPTSDQRVPGVTETSRNITARVIERDTSGEIYYILQDSRGFRTRQHGHQSHQNVHQSHQIRRQHGRQNDANLVLPPRFHQILNESPLQRKG